MPVRVFLSSILRKHAPNYDAAQGLEVELKGETTVSDLCRRMNLPEDKIKLVMVNGKNESLSYRLKGDERVALFPPVGGG
jgi:molybdopterin synthase sulfur carrier subunit